MSNNEPVNFDEKAKAQLRAMDVNPALSAALTNMGVPLAKQVEYLAGVYAFQRPNLQNFITPKEELGGKVLEGSFIQHAHPRPPAPMKEPKALQTPAIESTTTGIASTQDVEPDLPEVSEIVVSFGDATGISDERRAQQQKSYIVTDEGLRIQKGAIYQVVPLLERADPAAVTEFCWHVFNGFDLLNPEAKAISKEFWFRKGAQDLSKSIEDIVTTCFKPGKNGVAFQSEFLTRYMDADEVAMMRDPCEGRYNLPRWQEKRASLGQSTARNERFARENKAEDAKTGAQSGPASHLTLV